MVAGRDKWVVNFSKDIVENISNIEQETVPTQAEIMTLCRL